MAYFHYPAKKHIRLKLWWLIFDTPRYDGRNWMTLPCPLEMLQKTAS